MLMDEAPELDWLDGRRSSQASGGIGFHTGMVGVLEWRGGRIGERPLFYVTEERGDPARLGPKQRPARGGWR